MISQRKKSLPVLVVEPELFAELSSQTYENEYFKMRESVAFI